MTQPACLPKFDFFFFSLIFFFVVCFCLFVCFCHCFSVVFLVLLFFLNFDLLGCLLGCTKTGRQRNSGSLLFLFFSFLSFFLFFFCFLVGNEIHPIVCFIVLLRATSSFVKKKKNKNYEKNTKINNFFYCAWAASCHFFRSI